MIRVAAMLSAASLLQAQSPLVKRGSEIFSSTCAGAYCHGAEGSAGRAPQLAGRDFVAGNLFNVILSGRPANGMPGFSQQLRSEDIEAVTQYVLSLSGSTGGGAGLPPAAEKGWTLFFDAVRMGGCGKCHELDNRGTAVGPDLRALSPAQLRNLRAVSRARVVTASAVQEDPFPAVVAEQTPELIRVYDLSSPLPVLRTFQPSRVRIIPGSEWSHATAAQAYSEIELEAISDYLKWLARKQPEK